MLLRDVLDHMLDVVGEVFRLVGAAAKNLFGSGQEKAARLVGLGGDTTLLDAEAGRVGELALADSEAELEVLVGRLLVHEGVHRTLGVIAPVLRVAVLVHERLWVVIHMVAVGVAPRASAEATASTVVHRRKAAAATVSSHTPLDGRVAVGLTAHLAQTTGLHRGVYNLTLVDDLLWQRALPDRSDDLRRVEPDERSALAGRVDSAVVRRKKTRLIDGFGLRAVPTHDRAAGHDLAVNETADHVPPADLLAARQRNDSKFTDDPALHSGTATATNNVDRGHSTEIGVWVVPADAGARPLGSGHFTSVTEVLLRLLQRPEGLRPHVRVIEPPNLPAALPL